jgi:predicted alpha/beta superfamily hydrolase
LTQHASAPPPTWTGEVRPFGRIADAGLGNSREIWVYLPPSYARGTQRYPVLYFHDGQNVFDARTAFAGVEWGADETLERLARDGGAAEAIAVAIANTPQRIDEYTPVAELRGGGRAADYVGFLVQTVKPRIDAAFRTLPGRAHTASIGSSLGGLVSLYAAVHAPHVFGLAGALSPVFDWAGYDIEWRYEHTPAADLPLRVWIDMGTAEDSRPPSSTAQLPDSIRDLRRFARQLEARGFRRGINLGYEETDGARHEEAAWAERLPRVLEFLLPPTE